MAFDQAVDVAHLLPVGEFFPTQPLALLAQVLPVTGAGETLVGQDLLAAPAEVTPSLLSPFAHGAFLGWSLVWLAVQLLGTFDDLAALGTTHGFAPSAGNPVSD